MGLDQDVHDLNEAARLLNGGYVAEIASDLAAAADKVTAIARRLDAGTLRYVNDTSAAQRAAVDILDDEALTADNLNLSAVNPTEVLLAGLLLTLIDVRTMLHTLLHRTPDRS